MSFLSERGIRWNRYDGLPSIQKKKSRRMEQNRIYSNLLQIMASVVRCSVLDFRFNSDVFQNSGSPFSPCFLRPCPSGVLINKLSKD